MGKIGKSLSTIEERRLAIKKRNGTNRSKFYHCRIDSLRACRGCLWFNKRKLVARISGRFDFKYGHASRRISGCFVSLLDLGAWRISKRQVLTRRTAAIETLGAATVLCVDKTGTLTHNRLTLQGFLVNKKYQEISTTFRTLPERYHQLFEYGILSSQRDPFDPLEKEIKNKGEEFLKRIGTYS